MQQNDLVSMRHGVVICCRDVTSQWHAEVLAISIWRMHTKVLSPLLISAMIHTACWTHAHGVHTLEHLPLGRMRKATNFVFQSVCLADTAATGDDFVWLRSLALRQLGDC